MHPSGYRFMSLFIYIRIEGVCQEKWKRPRDGERQPLQAEYTHAGPALHTELWRHRRTWFAMGQEQKRQASPTFDLTEQNLNFWNSGFFGVKHDRQPSVRTRTGMKRSRSDRFLGSLRLSSSFLQGLTSGVKNTCISGYRRNSDWNFAALFPHVWKTKSGKLQLEKTYTFQDVLGQL